MSINSKLEQLKDLKHYLSLSDIRICNFTKVDEFLSKAIFYLEKEVKMDQEQEIRHIRRNVNEGNRYCDEKK